MMSAPDRVDVELPNTEEVKMTSVSSTGNLRNLVPPDQGHQHACKFFSRLCAHKFDMCVLYCRYISVPIAVKKVYILYGWFSIWSILTICEALVGGWIDRVDWVLAQVIRL